MNWICQTENIPLQNREAIKTLL